MFAIVRKGVRNYIILGIICIPLFLINVRDWSDWGDDFAQYLHQAENIIAGIPQSETGYIFNEDYPVYGPPAYPAGFPLLLTPVIKWKGNNILLLNIYITVFLSLFALLLFKFLSRFYSDLISFILVVLVLYNPWTLSFKADIISDIPFTFFTMLLIYLFTLNKKHNLKFLLVFSILCAFTFLIRSAGISFILALVFHSIFEYFSYRKSKSNRIKKEISFHLALGATSFVFYYILNKIMFPVSDKDFFNYSKIVDSGQFLSTIQYNLTYNTGVLRAFFEPWNDNWHFVSIISASMIFTFIILGMIRKMILQYDFLDSFFIVYLIVIFVYPYSNAGFRFLLPLIPVLLIYLVKGLMSVDTGIRFNSTKTAIALALVVLFSYKKGITDVYKSKYVISEGPQVEENKVMFSFIKDSLETDARFSFKRPRALALYTGRSAMTHRKDATIEEIDKNIRSKNIRYILINSEDYDQNILDYIGANGNKINKIWENSRNTIYRIN